MTAALREPRTAGGAVSRLAAILTARGIDPTVETSAGPEPVTALEPADARIPPRYRQALADHPRVTAWAAEITRTGRPGPAGAPGIATGPSLLIAGPTGTGKTHLAYGAIRTLLAAGVRLRWEATTVADLYAAQRPSRAATPSSNSGAWPAARSCCWTTSARPSSRSGPKS